MQYLWGPGDPTFGQSPVWAVVVLTILLLCGGIVTVMSFWSAANDNSEKNRGS